MKYLSLLLFSCSVLYCATTGYSHELPEGAVPLARSEECASCHPTIYKEWMESFHAKSSALENPAHGAVHQAFVQAMEEKGKKGNYHCANCHTPMADNIKELMAGTAELDSKNWTHTEGTGCTFCHRIESIIEKDKFNQYKLNKDGAIHTSRPAKKGLPHATRQSDLFAEGKVCMGCHSHKINSNDVAICQMKDEVQGNCLECHMPKIAGRSTVGTDGKTHRSHKMPGGHDKEMLKKAASLDATISSEGEERSLVVTVQNMIKHTFPSTNPMRIAFVKVVAKDKEGKKIWENFKESPLEDKQALFFQAFRAGEKKGVPSWAAEGIAFDTRLKAEETRTMTYPLADPTIAQVDVMLIYRLFPPKAIKGFAIPEDGVNEKAHIIAIKSLTL
ncbi:multiheme c-type cytochrome [Candidatus Electrothrix sp.]|uniref:multiheme c-type cytochrome n=1 Tax=Candidatus Electrothrix sp. TaxID=2170559 RepID=UPI004055CD53